MATQFERASTTSQPHRSAARFAVAAVTLLTAAACLPASPTAPDPASAARLPVGTYYLRSIDGGTLPRTLPGGLRIESGFVASDSIDATHVGFGESIARDRTASVRLATGTARVVAANARSGHVAAITWQAPAASAGDSVRWSADSVIVYRTGVAPSVAGAGHRLVYTRAVAADTL